MSRFHRRHCRADLDEIDVHWLLDGKDDHKHSKFGCEEFVD